MLKKGFAFTALPPSCLLHAQTTFLTDCINVCRITEYFVLTGEDKGERRHERLQPR